MMAGCFCFIQSSCCDAWLCLMVIGPVNICQEFLVGYVYLNPVKVVLYSGLNWSTTSYSKHLACMT